MMASLSPKVGTYLKVQSEDVRQAGGVKYILSVTFSKCYRVMCPDIGTDHVTG